MTSLPLDARVSVDCQKCRMFIKTSKSHKNRAIVATRVACPNKTHRGGFLAHRPSPVALRTKDEGP